MAPKSTKGISSGSYRSIGKTYDGIPVIEPATKPTHFSREEIRSTIQEVLRPIYVEPHAAGGYVVRREGSKRASAVMPTQREAIERARELEPNKRPQVMRVRNIMKDGVDKFRKT